MLKLSESNIEDIIHSSPWLLDERYLIPNILGSRGEKGRQINIGKNSSRFIDLLFKDTRDNRPVIIELKKGRLSRETIAQILEYRALLLTLEEDQKEEWKSEFAENFYVPKLMLIGTEADDATIISANLAGIDLRLFGNSSTLDLGFESLKKVKVKLKEYNDIRHSGNRSLTDRHQWIDDIIDKVNNVVQGFKNEVSAASSRSTLKGGRNSYIDYYFPYLNIPIYYKEEVLIGIYEYFDEFTPFDKDFIYLDFAFILEYDAEDKLSKKAFRDVETLADQFDEIDVINDPDNDNIPNLRIRRTVLEDENRFNVLLTALIKKGIKVFKDTFEDK